MYFFKTPHNYFQNRCQLMVESSSCSVERDLSIALIEFVIGCDKVLFL
jgi:hypothetical protein